MDSRRRDAGEFCERLQVRHTFPLTALGRAPARRRSVSSGLACRAARDATRLAIRPGDFERHLEPHVATGAVPRGRKVPAYIVRIMQDNELRSIPDDELLRRLSDILRQSRRVEADLVAHIAEVDARRLYARSASPSMFAYATEVLYLSEAEAYLRIAAARASREHPILLAMLADGRLHLTAIAKIAPHLTAENREGLLARAAHKSKSEIEELVAEVSPRPDVPAVTRRLPDRPGRDAVARLSALDGVGAAVTEVRSSGDVTCGPELRLDGVAAQSRTAGGALREALPRSSPNPRRVAPGPGALQGPVHRIGGSPGQARAAARPHAHLGAGRGPGCDHRAGGQREAGTTRGASVRQDQQAEEDGGGERHVTADAADPGRDQAGRVRARPGPMPLRGRSGQRCAAREGLQFHHRHPFGFGGDHSVGNIALMCEQHNHRLAEIDYGQRAMEGPEPPGGPQASELLRHRREGRAVVRPEGPLPVAPLRGLQTGRPRRVDRAHRAVIPAVHASLSRDTDAGGSVLLSSHSPRP